MVASRRLFENMGAPMGQIDQVRRDVGRFDNSSAMRLLMPLKSEAEPRIVVEPDPREALSIMTSRFLWTLAEGKLYGKSGVDMLNHRLGREFVRAMADAS